MCVYVCPVANNKFGIKTIYITFDKFYHCSLITHLLAHYTIVFHHLSCIFYLNFLAHLMSLSAWLINYNYNQ